ncbi:RHS repeat-associated core domain-containing protein [Actinosynnema sp. NPDC091369]
MPGLRHPGEAVQRAPPPSPCHGCSVCAPPSQPVPHRCTGKEVDSETGLYYFGARYYDPRTQLWQSPDPAPESYLDGAPNAGVHSPSDLVLVDVGIEGVRQAVKGQFDGGRLAGTAAAGVVSGRRPVPQAGRGTGVRARERRAREKVVQDHAPLS